MLPSTPSSRGRWASKYSLPALLEDCAQLKAGARPAASPDDPSVITSAADCRLTAYESVDQAKKIWIKGQNFTLPTLFDDEALARDPAFIHGAALAIFRLAPSDYHRFHSPVSCSIESTRRVPGCYYTVKCAVSFSRSAETQRAQPPSRQREF